MSKFTAPQLKALKSAVDTGNAWNAWGMVWRSSTDRMMKALCAQGLLTHAGHPTDKTASALGLPIAYGAAKVGARVISAGIETREYQVAAIKDSQERHPVMSDCASKFKDEPLYECEIPGSPGRVTYGKDAQIVGRVGRSTPPGTYVGKVDDVIVLDGNVRTSWTILGEDGKPEGVSNGFTYRSLIIKPVRPHKVKRYNTVSLGIDKHKVSYSARCNNLEDLRRLDAQDAKVCAIEVDLAQYDGKKRTPVRDKRVKRLVKILKRLKRGIYC